jgi:hypothetical protein
MPAAADPEINQPSLVALQIRRPLTEHLDRGIRLEEEPGIVSSPGEERDPALELRAVDLDSPLSRTPGNLDWFFVGRLHTAPPNYPQYVTVLLPLACE